MLTPRFRKIILSLKGFRWATKFEKQTTVFLLFFPKVTKYVNIIRVWASMLVGQLQGRWMVKPLGIAGRKGTREWEERNKLVR